jgi:hypothetical protein
MEIDTHYNFTEGKTAQLLKDKLNLSFESFRNISMEVIKGINESKIKFTSGFAFYQDGENLYLMFHFKKHCYTFWGGVKRLPKHHPFNCKTLEKFSGFIFSNKMPVDIHSKDEHKVYRDQELSLCGNCSKEIFKSWWGSDNPWYESVLQFVDQQETPTFKQDGYHSMWSQISEAYRERVNWVCEDCEINLSSINDREYLHTHHKNGNTKDNQLNNFQALCLLCHSLQHRIKLENGTGFYEVETFIRLYKDRLKCGKIRDFESIR